MSPAPEAVGQPADDLGRLRRVLGDVAGALRRLAGGRLEGPRLELEPPPDLAAQSASRRAPARGRTLARPRRAPPRTAARRENAGPGAWTSSARVAWLRAIQPDHAVEVQRPAALILRDLHVRHPHPAAKLAMRHAGQPRELARDLDRRPPPQLRRERVPDHRLLVVKALRAQRLTQPRIVLRVDLAARQSHAHAGRPPRGAAAGSAAAGRSLTRREWTAPEARRGQRHEHRSGAQ